jgi:hypothetical protein
MNDMNKRFSVKLCSDFDYEDMVVDISIDNNTIAILNMDKGVENMEIKFIPVGDDLLEFNVPLNDFIDVILFAKKCLAGNDKT